MPDFSGRLERKLSVAATCCGGKIVVVRFSLALIILTNHHHELEMNGPTQKQLYPCDDNNKEKAYCVK